MLSITTTPVPAPPAAHLQPEATSAQADDSNSLSGGQIAGIVAGSILGSTTLLLAVFAYVRHRHRKTMFSTVNDGDPKFLLVLGEGSSLELPSGGFKEGRDPSVAMWHEGLGQLAIQLYSDDSVHDDGAAFQLLPQSSAPQGLRCFRHEAGATVTQRGEAVLRLEELRQEQEQGEIQQHPQEGKEPGGQEQEGQEQPDSKETGEQRAAQAAEKRQMQEELDEQRLQALYPQMPSTDSFVMHWVPRHHLNPQEAAEVAGDEQRPGKEEEEEVAVPQLLACGGRDEGDMGTPRMSPMRSPSPAPPPLDLPCDGTASCREQELEPFEQLPCGGTVASQEQEQEPHEQQEQLPQMLRDARSSFSYSEDRGSSSRTSTPGCSLTSPLNMSLISPLSPSTPFLPMLPMPPGTLLMQLQQQQRDESTSSPTKSSKPD